MPAPEPVPEPAPVAEAAPGSDPQAAPEPVPAPRLAVAEFFAGVGLARLGLEATGAFEVVWANDVDPDKCALYRGQFDGAPELLERDLHDVGAEHLPERPVALAWASFPCTDVSLAGERRGLDGRESATWWAFVRVLGELARADRAPDTVTVENVLGLATSNGGRDLEAVVGSLNDLGYVCDLLTIDARWFLPQSRPRVFVVGARSPGPSVGWDEPDALRPAWVGEWVRARPHLKTWAAATPPPPPPETWPDLDGFLEAVGPRDRRWWRGERRRAFLGGLSAAQRERLDGLRAAATTVHRTAYRRTRDGRAVWEIRPDAVAGCLRTVRGGSSKQAVVEAGRGQVRVRWMTPAEYAALMGAPDYALAGRRPTQVYFGFGDAVAAPAVSWLAEHLLRRIGGASA